MASKESRFMRRNVPRLLKRYDISYCKEADCIEYFIADKTTTQPISYAIVLSLNRNAKEIHVSRFCPELYCQLNSRYLSAACFYLVIHHFGHVYHLAEDYNISLDTRHATFQSFFSRLKDFDFHIAGTKFCKTAALLSKFPPSDIDTSMITKKAAEQGDIPFHIW